MNFGNFGQTGTKKGFIGMLLIAAAAVLALFFWWKMRTKPAAAAEAVAQEAAVVEQAEELNAASEPSSQGGAGVTTTSAAALTPSSAAQAGVASETPAQRLARMKAASAERIAAAKAKADAARAASAQRVAAARTRYPTPGGQTHPVVSTRDPIAEKRQADADRRSRHAADLSAKRARVNASARVSSRPSVGDPNVRVLPGAAVRSSLVKPFGKVVASDYRELQ